MELNGSLVLTNAAFQTWSMGMDKNLIPVLMVFGILLCILRTCTVTCMKALMYKSGVVEGKVDQCSTLHH